MKYQRRINKYGLYKQRGEVGSITTAVSRDKSVTISRMHDVTIVTTRDRNTGEVSSEIFFGDSPFGA